MKGKGPKNFFGSQEPHSAIKAAIVAAYFPTWATILGKTQSRVLYLDFFCGPGKYDDDSESTPLLILRKAIDTAGLGNKVVTIFGDRNAKAVDRLREAVAALPGVGSLKYQPLIQAGVVGKALQEELAAMNLVPTLMFLDPFGYKAVNVDIIRAIIKNHGSECVFFFNYNRVMPAITNPGVRHLVDAIFGEQRVNELQEVFPSLSDEQKEAALIGALRESMSEIGGGYTLPFRFRKNGRVFAHLVFVSTHPLGHKIMKEIMAKKSSDSVQGVPSFEFREGTMALDMFAPKPLDVLKNDLLQAFAGRTITVEAIFNEHNLGTPYTMRNYKEALKELTREGKIPVGQREAGKEPLKSPYKTMPEDVSITFPASAHG